MQLSERIDALVKLGTCMVDAANGNGNSAIVAAISSAQQQNPWFDTNSVTHALKSIGAEWLNLYVLNKWISTYPQGYFNPISPKKIGVVMAGNIPLVGFQDLLCVIATGNRFVGKNSSKDGGILQAVTSTLVKIEPRFAEQITYTENLQGHFDYIIATGSNNTARYFEYHYKNIPSIIRHNRNSIAVLTGTETNEELMALAKDIFTYFGLGCRNVSLLMAPKGYNVNGLLRCFAPWDYVGNNTKYSNNYRYNKALLKINGKNFTDNGFLLAKEDFAISSPVAVINYWHYNSMDEVNEFIALNSSSIQCVVANSSTLKNAVPFGCAQSPTLMDYPDNIDIIDFINR
ncbi:MAG: aldehyde dehydrogenase [Bacteroidales bacterium]|nr:aldehyde dehydrogenase [Bacteroidales bacterium]MBN2747983.1 aldehyde dehydrogenase [Bacteroidales bacterium]